MTVFTGLSHFILGYDANVLIHTQIYVTFPNISSMWIPNRATQRWTNYKKQPKIWQTLLFIKITTQITTQ